MKHYSKKNLEFENLELRMRQEEVSDINEMAYKMQKTLSRLVKSNPRDAKI
jgi:hypothetical protein